MMTSQKKDRAKMKKENKYRVGKLTVRQRKGFDKLIERYGDIFVKDKSELGRMNVNLLDSSH